MAFFAKNTPKSVIPHRCDCHPGDTIAGRYRVESVLGEGAFGCVYKVTDASGTIWALKLLRLWEVPSDIRQQLTDRFEMEYQTGRIPSRNLVHSVDYGYMEGNPYIVMEFCSGGDLGAKIGSKDADMVRYAKDVLGGLRDLHREGKVHRDLKPENVLLKSDGTAVLTDFGISGDRNIRMTERNIFGKPYQIFGTYAYMPPEQVNRGRAATVLPTTDIFSFGVLFYQLITGQLPFGVLNDQNDLVRYQKRGAAGDWDRTTLLATPNGARWMSLIESCLKPDYKVRIQSADELMHLLPYDIVVNQPVNKTPMIQKRPTGYQLRVMQGVEFGKVYYLDQILAETGRNLITLGRDPQNTIQLVEYDEPYASRFHFTIERDKNVGWIVRDGQWFATERRWINSTNSTFVNSAEAIIQGILLKSGDIISAGEIKLKFEEL